MYVCFGCVCFYELQNHCFSWWMLVFILLVSKIYVLGLLVCIDKGKCGHCQTSAKLVAACLCLCTGGETIDTSAVTTTPYLIHYTAVDALGNIAVPVSRSVTVYNPCLPQAYCTDSGGTHAFSSILLSFVTHVADAACKCLCTHVLCIRQRASSNLHMLLCLPGVNNLQTCGNNEKMRSCTLPQSQAATHT